MKKKETNTALNIFQLLRKETTSRLHIQKKCESRNIVFHSQLHTRVNMKMFFQPNQQSSLTKVKKTKPSMIITKSKTTYKSDIVDVLTRHRHVNDEVGIQ